MLVHERKMAESSLIIEDGMMSSTFIKSLFDEKRDVERTIMNICKAINPHEDPINVLADLTPKQRQEISCRIQSLCPKMCPPTKYCASYGGVSNYDNEKDVTVGITTGFLPETSFTEFNVDIPLDADRLYINDQYFRTKLVMETLSTEIINEYIANPPAGLAVFDPSNIRYRWVAKPGIRFIQDVTLVSDVTELQTFTQNIVLYMDKEYIPDRSQKLWNHLIGHDLGDSFEVVYPDTACTEVATIKVGYQTPKLVPQTLEMMIPLWYDFNLDPNTQLNTGVFKQGSISYTGHLAPGSYMAIAEYYDDVIGVYKLATPRVSIEKFSLVGNYTKLSEYLHALNICQPWSRVISIIKEEKHIIQDLDEVTLVKSKSVAEMLTACIRPPSYEKDFDLWVHFSKVEPSYAQIPIVMNDPILLTPSQVAIGRGVYYKPVSIIDKIGVVSDEIEIKEVTDPVFYSTLLAYKDGFKATELKPDVFAGLYRFKFNEHFPYKQFSALMNFAALDNTSVKFVFKEGLVDRQNILNEKYEIIFFVHTLNVFKSYDRSMGLSWV